MSVTLCDVDRFRPEHLHQLAKGPLTYILRTAFGRTDGRDVYSVMISVPMIVFLGVGTQLRRHQVLSRRPNAGARGGVSFSG